MAVGRVAVKGGGAVVVGREADERPKENGGRAYALPPFVMRGCALLRSRLGRDVVLAARCGGKAQACGGHPPQGFRYDIVFHITVFLGITQVSFTTPEMKNY